MAHEKIVLNLEPYGYSKIARQKWMELGYTYREALWKEIGDCEIFDVEVLIVRLERNINSFDLEKFPSLKYLVSATTGLDHIDLKVLEARKIKLISLRGENEFLKTIPSTAEHTWALLMSLIRNVPNANESVKKGDWKRDKFRGYQLKDKTFAIIGLGRTGTMVKNYALAFGMKVIYYDPMLEKFTGAEKCNTLEELTLQADIISIHVHLDKTTENMVDNQFITRCKRGVCLLNTSRGKIIDETAVVAGLKSGMVKGVAIDVLATELDNIQQSPLWHAQKAGENVIITPHIGGASWDAMWACEEYLVNLIG